MPEKTLQDVIIVGAGPAGISCALALRQLGYEPVVIEAAEQCGGRLRELAYHRPGIGDSPSLATAAFALTVTAVDQSLDIRLGIPAAEVHIGDQWIALVLEDGTVLGAQFLVLASGISPRTGDLIELPGREFGPRDVVATSQIKDRSVAILGGGDSAFQAYHAFREAQAGQVTIFARHIRARAQLVFAVPEGDIVLGEYEVNPHHNVINGRPFDVIRICYGYEVRPEALLGLDLEISPERWVVTDDRYQTSMPRVFAIGDIAGRTRPSCTAAFAQGLAAAREIQGRLDHPDLEALRARLLKRRDIVGED